MWIDQRGSEILDRPECLRLLAVAAKEDHVGRLAAVTEDQSPLVVPLNFIFHDGGVLVRVGPGRLSELVPDSLVAFEVDRVEPDRGTAWSVLVRGLASRADTHSPSGEAMPEPWVPEPRPDGAVHPARHRHRPPFSSGCRRIGRRGGRHRHRSRVTGGKLPSSAGESGRHHPDAGRSPGLSPALDRRFEAVVLWGVGPEALGPGAAPLRLLARAGVLVGVISPLSLDEVVRLLRWPAVDAADLVVAGGNGTVRAIVDEDGVHAVSPPPSMLGSATGAREAVIWTR